MPFRSLVLVSLALLGTGSLSAQEYRGPIIDAHAHIRLGDNDALSDDQGKGTAPIRALDIAAGVTKSALIVIAPARNLSETRARNDAVIAAVAADPAHFYPVASVHPGDGAAAIAELDRLAKLGVRQIKLHPNAQQFDVADPAVAQITEHCGKLGIAVLFDSYNPLDPAQVGKLVVLTMKQPKTRFMLAHMTFSQFRETMTFAMFQKMGRSDNVWFDNSAIAVAYAGSPVQPELVWTMRQLGMNRIIFGSDWPVDTPATALAAVRKLGLTPDEQKRVLHDNIAALLDLEAKPAR